MPVGIQISLKWENLDRLIRYLDYLPEELRKWVQYELHEGVAEIRDEAKRYCPVDTGSLQKSIRIQNYSRLGGVMEKIGVSAGGYVINPKTGNMVDYASYVEYGTSGSPAQPFLRPAFENKRASLRQRLRHAIRKALMSY